MVLSRLTDEKTNASLTMEQLYENLEKQICEKKELTQRLDEERKINVILIKTISHDLANPLFAIKSYLEMISTGRILQKDYGQTLGRISDCTKSALDMIQRIRNAILTRNQSSLTKIESVDINLSVTNLLTLFETRLHEKNIQVIYDYEANKETFVAAELKTLTEHVFSNVLSNALKFSYANSTIRILVTEKDKHVYVEFVDNGMGFNQLRSERGYIHPNQATDGEMGPGLGLIIMGHFLRKFEGTYNISSEGQGKGTKVLIQLKKIHQQRLVNAS